MPGRLARFALLAGVLCIYASVARGGDAPKNFGPQRPLVPRAGRTDAMLFAKAMRIQARMWWHLTPEGLLATQHRRGASPDRLSHDVLALGDAAIWTGCYAASQACRWLVTRDPDALAQLRHLAKGLALLSDVTGIPGRLVRTAGRLAPGEPVPPGLSPSATHAGLSFRDDVSRDQLSGVILGWACIARFVRDDALRELARAHVTAIARRLHADRMWLRNAHGGKTKYGELRPDVEYLPFLKNGVLASIGYAPFVLAAALDPAPYYEGRLARLHKAGYRHALSEQFMWVKGFWGTSGINMVHLSLLAICLHGSADAARRARLGMLSYRKATVGWWNAGLCACQLLGGLAYRRREIEDEVRVTLHVQSEEEVPPYPLQYRYLARIATARDRGVSTWAWKDTASGQQIQPADGRRDPVLTYTRADWLFAYWLARASGSLKPASGPGVATPVRCDVDYPPWMRGE